MGTANDRFVYGWEHLCFQCGRFAAFPFVNGSDYRADDNRERLGDNIYRLKGRPHPKFRTRRTVPPMASSPDNPQVIASAPSGSSANETARARSVATRLTEAEFSEVEAAASSAGKKVAEWLREAALAQAREGKDNEQTDQVLLAELVGMRSLMLNLFARASQGPLTAEDIKKMSAYSESVKEQRAADFLNRRRLQKQARESDDEP
jgi:hypothetical protein